MTDAQIIAVCDTKTCSKCKEIKPRSCFNKDTKRKDGLQCHCNDCRTAYNKANREKSAQRSAVYRHKHPQKVASQHAAWRSANKPKTSARSAAWRSANPDRCAETGAAWKIANKDKIIEQTKAYYAANKEKESARGAAYRKAYPEKHAARSAAWSRANPEARRIIQHNRRAKKEQNGGHLSRDIANLLLLEQGGKCACCLVDLLTTGHHLDHVMPIALGGRNTDDNVQLLCPSCNFSKGARHPLDWMSAKGIFQNA
jgi:5-methylcytosine-specific restriction endonuclease McrA